MLVRFHVHPGIILSVEHGDGGELGNCQLALFSAIVHLQDVLQECCTGGQRSSSVLLSGEKPTGPNSSDVPGRQKRLLNRLPLFQRDTKCICTAGFSLGSWRG